MQAPSAHRSSPLEVLVDRATLDLQEKRGAGQIAVAFLSAGMLLQLP